MCGITGGYAFTDSGLVYLEKISGAVQNLRLRGPDNSGVYKDKNVALGQARLSIIDVSEAASQPFTDATGRYTITFNGEIFNFLALRKELENKGITFRSNSDTEVLLYGYITEGHKFLTKLNGFFAFCIYDKLTEELFIARDRIGIKPLYLYSDEKMLLFASELKALMAYGIPREIDHVSLFSYLQLNYIPAPASIFKNVVKVEPGTFIKINGRDIITDTFYKIPYNQEKIESNHDNYATACVRIRELMDESVKRRLISDVPLGAFLSGGVDSSVIVALASRHTDKLNTFSIGFKDEPLFDETNYAIEVAEKYKTNHSVFSLTTDDLYSILFDVLDYIDEPFADSSALAVYILSRETRKHVTVALSGDGADELYGGYIKHSAESRMRQGGLIANMVKWGSPFWKILPKSRNSAFGNKIRQLDRFASGIGMSHGDRYWRWASYADEKTVNSILLKQYNYEEYFSRKNHYTSLLKKNGNLNDVFYADMHLVLRNDMLVKVDMMSMANSLEVRVPFLDHEHVNYVFSLPWFYKAGPTERKKILQDAFRDFLPESIYHRPKHGFEVPLLRWFRTELKPLINDELLNNDFIIEQGIFEPAEINRLLRKVSSSDPGDAAARIWGLIVFQYWWKKYIK